MHFGTHPFDVDGISTMLPYLADCARVSYWNLRHLWECACSYCRRNRGE